MTGKRGGRGGRRAPRARPTSRRSRPPSIDDMAGSIVRGGVELLAIEDPLEAEAWASAMLGAFYKIDAPLEARDELEVSLWPAVCAQAEVRGDRAGLAVLDVLGAVADDPLAARTRAAAGRLRAAGVVPPSWAGELGSVVFEGAWVMLDVFGDHEAWYATFRYPGRQAHLVNALYDKAMGEIIKDAFVGYASENPRDLVALEDGVSAVDAAPERMARRVIDAIASGDLYLDNDWTPEFKRFRALLLARMRSLPISPAIDPPEPLGDDERDVLIGEFLASGSVAGDEEADIIASHCLDYLCDYLSDDPFRWSPIVVEQFLLDYLPRKVSLTMGQIRQLSRVLRAWVRFALTKRGLDERWIVETEEAVDQFAADFRRAATDADEFGLAKTLGMAILADGIDPLDQAAVDRWIEEFNRRPLSERDRLLDRLTRS